jgi:hypothetical protein
MPREFYDSDSLDWIIFPLYRFIKIFLWWKGDGAWNLQNELLYKPCQLCRAKIITEVQNTEAETCRECPEASKAFAMGTHARLGANSLIGLLENDLIHKIVSFI